MLTLPVDSAPPAAKLPLGSFHDVLLHVYDGVPDEQPWLDEALAQSRICSVPEAATALSLLAAEGLGAPYGAEASRSVRTARVTGLAVGPDKVENTEHLLGVGVAHGCCYVRWENSLEGPQLAVEFQWPTAFGWGKAKDALGLEHLKVRCLRQYESQMVSILEQLEGANLAKGISVSFEGDWDETTILFRLRLTQASVGAWAKQLSERQSITRGVCCPQALAA